MAGGPYKGKGEWYYIVWTNRKYHPHNPKIAETLKTKMLGQARKKKAELEQQYYSGEHDPWVRKWFERAQAQSPASTLWEAAEDYFSYKRGQKGQRGWKSRQTVVSHRNVIRKFIDYVGEHRHPEAITDDVLSSFYHQSSIKSDYTRKSYQAKVSAFLRWMASQGYIDLVPAAEVDPPQKEVKEYIRDEKLQRIFNQLEAQEAEVSESKYSGYQHNSTWYADFCRVALETGLRSIELIQLKVSDITDSDIIVGKSFTVKTRFQRQVPLSPAAKKIIDSYRDPELRARDYFLSRNAYLWGRNSLASRDRITHALREAAAALDPALHLTVGSLRHLFAIRYLMQAEGDDQLRLLRLMNILGHRDLSTTQKYLNYLPSDGVF